MIFEHPEALRASGFAPMVCIVGSGPAGLSLALGLGAHGVPSLVLEAGGIDPSPAMQEPYRGTVVGDPFVALDQGRLRCFGGTSVTWEGWCRPLDAVDFEARAGVPDSGWPIGKPDLDPYAAATDRMLGIDPRPPDRPVTRDLDEIEFTVGRAARFGSMYRQEIASSPLIGLMTRAAVVDLVPARGRIDAVRVHTPGRADTTIRAPWFCLCTGGIENSRLLLWANARHQQGVVPGARTLGRYWMDHPLYGVGDAIVVGNPGESPTGMRFFAPSAGFLRRTPVGSAGIRMFVGTQRIKRLFKSGLCIAPQVFDDLMRKYNAGYACGMRLLAGWEQLPLASNRIELDTDERDSLGMPRVRLHWRKSAVERETIHRALTLLGRYLADSDIGRVRLHAWLAHDRDYPEHSEGAIAAAGFHHMGGTRMAADPEHGVVDAQCRVFGMDNLYVGGSSVFPTGGHTNPTYTIVQLALRLADRLSTRISGANSP